MLRSATTLFRFKQTFVLKMQITSCFHNFLLDLALTLFLMKSLCCYCRKNWLTMQFEYLLNKLRNPNIHHPVIAVPHYCVVLGGLILYAFTKRLKFSIHILHTDDNK